MFGFAKKAAAAKKALEKHEAAYTNKNGVFTQRSQLESLIPWVAIDPDGKDDINLVYNHDYALFTVFKFRGPDMDSATKTELMQFNYQLNNVMKSLPTGYVLYFDAHRHFATDYDSSDMPTPLTQLMDDERRDYYASKVHFDTDYYFVVYQAPPNFLARKFLDFFVEKSKNTAKFQANGRLYFEYIDKFRDRAMQISNMLALIFNRNIEQLNCQETLTYLHSLVSDRQFNVKPNPMRFIKNYITDAGFIGGRNPQLGSKHMKIITILNFPPVTTPGVFDALNALNIEYRWVSRFICLSRTDGMEELSHYVKLWGQQVKGFFTYIREAITQTELQGAIDESAVDNKEDAMAAQRELGADFVSYGYYTMTLIVMDTDKQACADKANRLLETLNSLGYTGFIETENSVESWRGTLPGCYKCNIRRPIVSSLNFCHMAPTTAVWSGDKNNEHLKGPVLLYTDSSGYTPFRLSLHDGDVGHTLIVGPSGSGKSVLLNTLEAHFQKYANSNVFIFDKAASSRALTYAVGGHFYNLAAEGMQDLSFQPLAHIDDEKEMKWAKEWIMAYLVQKNVTVTPQEEIYVWNALKSLAVMPQNQRTLTVFTEFVQSHEIRQALQALTAKGSYGKLFDNNKEFSGTGSWQVYEMETLMGTPGIVAPTLDYLFHRIETRISKAAGPSLIVLDECWLFLDNPIFQAKLKEYFKDMRKKNTSIWIATQQLSDIASKPALMDTVNDQCKHKIFLPNGNATSDANKDLYRIFGCNTRQTEIISKMTPKQDYYYSDRDKGNRLFRLALQPSELPFVTATSKTDQIKMDQIMMAGKQDDFIHEWLSYKNADEEWEKYQTYRKRYASPSPSH